MIVYECEICGALHPWDWDGDCRDDANRYHDVEEYARAKGVSVYDVEIRSMEDRLRADAGLNETTSYTRNAHTSVGGEGE